MAKNDGMVNQWNESWRSSPQYTEIMLSIGVDPTKPMKLTDAQRKIVQARLEQIAGKPFDKGLEIDPAGNMNQNEGFGKQAKKWGPIAGGIALTLFGIPGVMPGVLSGGAAAPAVTTATNTATNVGGNVANAAAAGGGIWGALRNNIPGIVGGVGSMLTSGAEASAANRGTKIDVGMEANRLNQQAERDWYNQMVMREQEGRTNRNDSWKALQQGAYVENWKPSGQKFSPYTRDLVAPADSVREAGAARAADARTRLTGNNLPAPEKQSYTLDPKLLEGDMWEKIQGYLGTGMQGVDALLRRRPQAPVASTQPVRRYEPTIDDAMTYGLNF